MFRRFKQIKKLNKSKLTDDEKYEVDENGRGIIDVGAENFDDIYSYYNLNGENVLDKEFDEFMEAKADAIPGKVELSLHFHIKNASEHKREEIEKAVKDSYKRELRAINRKLHRNTLFSLYMLFYGIIALMLYIPFVIFDISFIPQTIFEIATWVFFWEATDSFFLTRRNLQIERLQKYRFIRADIEVYEYKEKKRLPTNFSNNVKTLNNMLNEVSKETKSTEQKIIKTLQSETEQISQENKENR